MNECNSETKSGFRASKAHQYRQLVRGQCQKEKAKQLAEMKSCDGSSFRCTQCQKECVISYARCGHEPSLRLIWQAFELLYTSITIDNSGENKRRWLDFHRTHAKLRVICKDCEALD
jgi:hypothetical protein